VTGAFGDTDTTTPNDSRYDALYDLLMLSGTSRTLQSFNNYPMGVAPSTAYYWLCQEHYDVYLANGGAAPGGTVIFDAGVVINAALAWSSAINLSTAQAPPYQQTPVQTARVLITERAICPLSTQIQIPDAGNCYIESITGEPLLHLVATLETGTGSPLRDGVIINETVTLRPPYVKLAGFSISKPFSYLTGWYDGVLVPSWSGGVLTSAPRNERDGSAGIWTSLIPYFAAPISTDLNAVIAMQQPGLPTASGGTGLSIVYFDKMGTDTAGNPKMSTRTVWASASAAVPVTIDPVTSAGAPLYYGAPQNTSLAQLATYVAEASGPGEPGLAGFNLRFLGLGALVVGGFQVAPHGIMYKGAIVEGTGDQQGFGVLTITTDSNVPIVGTLLDATNTAPGTAVLQSLGSNMFLLTVSQTVAGPVNFTTRNFQGLFCLFGPPPNPDKNYGQGFNSTSGVGNGAIKFPAQLPKLAQVASPQTAASPEREARPAIPGTEIVFHTGYYDNGAVVHNGSPNDSGSGVVINYPLFLRGHALNLIGDDFEVAINTYGFSQGQAYLNGGGGGWRVPRAISLYNDMRQDTGTFRPQDCYYADGTPGPMQLGSGAGSVHFASGDQPIEPQQADSGAAGVNRPIDLIIDGARCWCPNAAALAVVATSSTGGTLTTQSRTSIRNSTLLSGAKTCAVNLKNSASTLSCQLYIENTDIDGWFQDSDGAIGIQVLGESGPANLTIGRNVRVLNAACQAINCSGLGTIVMSDDFLAGQPQINVVPNRASGATTLGWTQIPNAVIACANSLIAGEFQALAPSTAPAPGPVYPGSPLQIGAPTQTGTPPIYGNADYTHIRVRLTYVPSNVYAMVITNAVFPVIDSAVGVSNGSGGSLGLNLLQTTASGSTVNAPAVNVCINSLHFQRLDSAPITTDSYSNYYTNTGDIWWPPGSPVTMVQSPAFAALLLA
jgi:hypothetical protein